MENLKDDDSDNYEEEEIIVCANFEEGTLDRDIFQQPDLKFKVIGLDSETPIVQLGEATFKGAWNDTIGTKVFFEEDPLPDQADPVFTVVPPKMLKFKCMSTKTLDLSRIFLKPKNQETNTKDTNKGQNPDTENEFVGGEQDVLELAQSTINPDSNTSAVMKEIVEETAMEVTEDNQDS